MRETEIQVTVLKAGPCLGICISGLDLFFLIAPHGYYAIWGGGRFVRLQDLQPEEVE
jgi:hypothetical protein